MAGKIEYKNKFASEKYDRVSFMLKNALNSLYRTLHKPKWKNINGYIKNTIKKQYKADTRNYIDL